MITVIFAAIVTTLSVLSIFLTIWQWFEARKKGKKTALILTALTAISIILSFFSTPKASNIIEQYKEYQAETVAQQAEDERSFSLAQEYIDEGKMFEAISQLQNISSHFVAYGESQELLSTSIDKYKSSTLAQAAELAKEGKLDDAINVLKTAMFLLPDDNDLSLKLEKYTNDLSQNIIDKSIKAAESYVNEGNYGEAIMVIKDALKYYPESQELRLQLSNYEGKFIEDTLATVKNFISEHNTDSAIDFLNKALSIVPQNEDLKAKLNECKNLTVNLSTLQYLNQNGHFNDRDITVANDGSFVNNGFVVYGSESFRTYALDGKYSAIVGTFALTEESKNDNVKCVLTINVDGQEYILDEVRAGVRPIPFDIPLLNAQNIKFTLFSEYYRTKVVVGDTVLYKAD